MVQFSPENVMYAWCRGGQSIAHIADIDSSSLSGSCQPETDAVLGHVVISGTEKPYMQCMLCNNKHVKNRSTATFDLLYWLNLKGLVSLFCMRTTSAWPFI